jgi:CheY-like chemotaxis protein
VPSRTIDGVPKSSSARLKGASLRSSEPSSSVPRVTISDQGPIATWSPPVVKCCSICASHLTQRDVGPNGETETSPGQEIRTVLIVEDDASVLRSLERLVQAAGYTVLGFLTPGDLLRSDIPRSSACLVVDINLPEMNGVELCDSLAAAGCRLPAILMTGQTNDPRTKRLIRSAQAVAVLYKPFAAALLLDALSAAF